MKKLFVVIVMFLVLIGSSSTKNDFSLLDYFDGEITVYTNRPIDDTSIHTGSCYLSTTSNYDKSDIIGESMWIDNFEPISAINELKAEIVDSEYLENGVYIIYAYTDLIGKTVTRDNKRVNIQIACYDDHSVIGWPLILGSF